MDGVLDRYRFDVRFGVATFDGVDSFVDAEPWTLVEEFDEERSAAAEGLWSYGSTTREGLRVRENGKGVGTYRFPLIDLYLDSADAVGRMDTGIRGPTADDGAVLHASRNETMVEINARIQESLQRTRPYKDTPIAASLDDVLYYFTEDPEVLAEGIDRQADRHVILITDGMPNDDFRAFGCNCEQTAADDCGADSEAAPLGSFFCPYPEPAEAAEALRERAVADVYVVLMGRGIYGAAELSDAIASAGGTQRARSVTSAEGLRRELEEIIEQILLAE